MKHTPTLTLRPALITGSVLLVPFVMTWLDRHKAVGEGWRWGPLDFVTMGALVYGATWAYECLARRLGSRLQRTVLLLFVLALVAGVWVELAVDGLSQLLGLLTRN